jgi:F420H(2)-dependent quinone reductase
MADRLEALKSPLRRVRRGWKNAVVSFVSTGMSDYNQQQIIEEFRANAGRVGGNWAGRNLLLLTTTGRKSGNKHTTPMVYTPGGDRLLVYGSNNGGPKLQRF